MHVGRYDYAGQFGDRLAEVVQDLECMLLEGRYVLSQEVEQFEVAFGKFLDTENPPTVCGVNSGTDALILSLMALGIGAGDEVITQANTFYATVAAIALVGATPVLVDVDPATFLIDPHHLTSSISERTKAIIPVHLYGKPTAMEPLLGVAAAHDVIVLEDAAQAHGARQGGRSVGTFGQVGCFSFHPSKNLAAAGDAGAVVTYDDQLVEKLQCLRSLGQRGQNHHVMVGYNTKLDSIQARVLTAKLPRLNDWNADRRRLAAVYRERLASLPLFFQREDEGEEHAYHLFQIGSEVRDDLFEYLRSAGIDCVIRYPQPIHLQKAFARFGWNRGQFPVAERLADELLCLPLYPGMTDAELDYVVDHVHCFFRERP